MFKVLKEHWFCSIVLTCATVFIGLVIAYAYWFFDRVYGPENFISSSYPIDVTTANTKMIDYPVGPYAKNQRCFGLAIEAEAFKERFPDDSEYSYTFENRYYDKKDSDEIFYIKAKHKPHFFIKIYKEGTLVDEKDIYMINSHSSYSTLLNKKRLSMKGVKGVSAPKKSACHQFLPNTQYTLEVINLKPLPEYNGIGTHFIVSTYSVK